MVAVLAACAAELPVRPAAVFYDASALEASGDILTFIYLVIHILTVWFQAKVKSIFLISKDRKKHFEVFLRFRDTTKNANHVKHFDVS